MIIFPHLFIPPCPSHSFSNKSFLKKRNTQTPATFDPVAEYTRTKSLLMKRKVFSLFAKSTVALPVVMGATFAVAVLHTKTKKTIRYLRSLETRIRVAEQRIDEYARRLPKLGEKQKSLAEQKITEETTQITSIKKERNNFLKSRSTLAKIEKWSIFGAYRNILQITKLQKINRQNETLQRRNAKKFLKRPKLWRSFLPIQMQLSNMRK